jgi:hypothetical protein
MRHLGSFRMYEAAVRLLAARGHHVQIVLDRGERLGWHGVLEQLIAECPTITWTWSASRQRIGWFALSRILRVWLDYLRYFEPAYASAPILRRRAAEQMPPGLTRVTSAWPFRTPAGLRLLRRVLRTAERALPREPAIDTALRAAAPDVMLLTPLIGLGSPQLDMLRSGLALGIRTALGVGSWDHLSSKALIRDVPHRVFVWNDTQRREAIELHGVSADRVVVTGAQCYDQWFDRAPSRSRDAFCAHVGLRADRPFILWTCSALFQGSPSEAAFVVAWLEALRGSDAAALRDVGVLIRPHPARRREWDEIALGQYPNVVLHGDMPADNDSKNDYFDSLFFSAAVAGLNTSAFLEAAVVGRPVHAILPEQFRDNQEGTLHFHYLRTEGGGLVRAATDFPTHHRQLLDSLSGVDDGRRPSFVEAFIRPHGLDVSASEVFVAAVESLAATPPPQPLREPLAITAVRLLLSPVAVATRIALGRLDSATDKTSREIQGARIKKRRLRKRERRRTEVEEAARVRQQGRDRDKAEALRRQAAAKQQRRADRDREVAESRREKEALRARRQREKQTRQRRERLSLLRQRILHKLGLA